MWHLDAVSMLQIILVLTMVVGVMQGMFLLGQSVPRVHVRSLPEMQSCGRSKTYAVELGVLQREVFHKYAIWRYYRVC